MDKNLILSQEKEIQLVAARNSDVDFVLKCVRELEATIPAEQFEEVYVKNLQNDNILYLLIMHQEKSIGFISIHFQYLLHHWSKVAEIQELVVLQEFRSLGIGRFVLAEAVAIAKSNGASLIELCTHQSRIDAHRFYDKNNWNKSHFKYTFPL